MQYQKESDAKNQKKNKKMKMKMKKEREAAAASAATGTGDGSSPSPLPGLDGKLASTGNKSAKVENNVEDDDDEEDDDEMLLVKEKLKRLEEMEKTMEERERQMKEMTRMAEERSQAMEKALKDIEDRMKAEEAERMTRNQLLDLAKGGFSARQDLYSTPVSHGQRGVGGSTARMLSSRSLLKGNSARGSARGSFYPDHAPSALSARESLGASKDSSNLHVPRVTWEGKEWLQFWDDTERLYYWYCPTTGLSQWETPGEEDGGYESTGGMTDYSTDYESGDWTDYEGGNSAGLNGWQEYYDEQAQAKYWYNAASVSELPSRLIHDL